MLKREFVAESRLTFFKPISPAGTKVKLQQYIDILSPNHTSLADLSFAQLDRIEQSAIDNYIKEMKEEKDELTPAKLSYCLVFDFVAAYLFNATSVTAENRKLFFEFYEELMQHIELISKGKANQWLPAFLSKAIDSSVSLVLQVESLESIAAAGRFILKKMIQRQEDEIYLKPSIFRDEILASAWADAYKTEKRWSVIVFIRKEKTAKLVAALKEVLYSDSVLNSALVYFMAAFEMITSQLESIMKTIFAPENKAIIKKIKAEIEQYCKDYEFDNQFNYKKMTSEHLLELAYTPAILTAILQGHLEAERYLQKKVTLDGIKTIFSPDAPLTEGSGAKKLFLCVIQMLMHDENWVSKSPQKIYGP